MTDSQKLDLLLSEMKEVKTDVRTLKEDVSVLKQKVSSLEDKVDELSQRTDTMEDKIVQINLILENEIRVNIQRMAEGHLDLSRNLHEAMQPNSEVEMLALRVGMLESDMRKVKEKLA
ncbi:MAG: hypothetical protein K2H37_13590 [Lachnospiraceae bacterium]|nr:hypothetical protein [Lachnospiraceae bacterium]